MGSYEEFAWVYDEFMDNVPYEKWCDQICSVLKREGIESGIVADLGCGTGELTELLAKQGYDMIGIDNAQEMLNVAMEKRYVSGLDILYLLQDMRSFELYGTCRAIISRCDSINYITSYEDLVQVFRLVNNYLDLRDSLSLIVIHHINIEKFLARRPLQKIVKMEALFGKILMMNRVISMNMTLHSIFRMRMDSNIGDMRRPICSVHIP